MAESSLDQIRKLYAELSDDEKLSLRQEINNDGIGEIIPEYSEDDVETRFDTLTEYWDSIIEEHKKEDQKELNKLIHTFYRYWKSEPSIYTGGLKMTYWDIEEYKKYEELWKEQTDQVKKRFFDWVYDESDQILKDKLEEYERRHFYLIENLPEYFDPHEKGNDILTKNLEKEIAGKSNDRLFDLNLGSDKTSARKKIDKPDSEKTFSDLSQPQERFSRLIKLYLKIERIISVIHKVVKNTAISWDIRIELIYIFYTDDLKSFFNTMLITKNEREVIDELEKILSQMGLGKFIPTSARATAVLDKLYTKFQKRRSKKDLAVILLKYTANTVSLATIYNKK